jgi:hypothetical protein
METYRGIYLRRSRDFISRESETLYRERERERVLIIEAASEIPRLLAEAAAR